MNSDTDLFPLSNQNIPMSDNNNKNNNDITTKTSAVELVVVENIVNIIDQTKATTIISNNDYYENLLKIKTESSLYAREKFPLTPTTTKTKIPNIKFPFEYDNNHNVNLIVANNAEIMLKLLTTTNSLNSLVSNSLSKNQNHQNIQNNNNDNYNNDDDDVNNFGQFPFINNNISKVQQQHLFPLEKYQWQNNNNNKRKAKAMQSSMMMTSVSKNSIHNMQQQQQQQHQSKSSQQQFKLLFPLNDFSHTKYDKFPLNEVNNNNNYNNNNDCSLMKLKKNNKTLLQATRNILNQNQLIQNNQTTNNPTEGIVYGIDLNNNNNNNNNMTKNNLKPQQFPFEYENFMNLRHFPMWHTEANKSPKNNNNNNNNINNNNEQENKHIIYNTNIDYNNISNDDNNNNNRNVENINLENYNKNISNAKIFFKNSINNCCVASLDEENNENQVHNNNNNKNNNRNHNNNYNNNNDNNINEEKIKSKSNSKEENSFEKIDDHELVVSEITDNDIQIIKMKAKVENIDNETQTINKNFVEKSQQQHDDENDKKFNIFSKFSEINENEPKMVIVEKIENSKANDNQIQTNNMMITTIMSGNNNSLDEQQKLSTETGEHLTPTNATTTIPIDVTCKRVNKTKPKQQQQLENVENEKQSEQLNESTETATTTTTTSTTLMKTSKMMMMMMNTTIAEFISSYSAESSDVRDQLSQEVREILRNQYNNQEEQEKEEQEQDIDANQILLLLNSNNLTKSPNTSNTPTSTITTNTIPTNIKQIVLNNESVVKNQQYNNNNSTINNWQQKALTTNENQESELKVTGDNDTLEEIKEMKFEMRSALTNNNNNNNNKTNTIDTSNYKHVVTNPISPTTIKHTNHATNIPQPLATTTTRSYLPSSNNKNVNHSTTTTTTLPTTKSSTERSLSLDTSLILPERTRLRRQRRMLSQGSSAEQNEDPVERLNRLRARISGALSQVKGVLKQYSADADVDAEENYTFTKSHDLSKPDTSKISSCPSSSSCLGSSSERLLTNSDKSIQVEKLKNASKQPAEMDKIGEEEEETETDDGPVNFRFVRKVRRRSNFNENDEVQKETTTNLQDVQIKCEPVKLDEETTSIPQISKAMEHNEVKGNNDNEMKAINENETQPSNDIETQVCKEIDPKIPIEVKASEVKKTVKKRIVIVKSKSGSAAAAARRASIAAVESSKIEPTVKKLLPVHIKSQRRPSDSGTLIKKPMLATDSGTCTNGSMEEQEKNVKLMHKVNKNQTNLSHLRRHDENAANDIGMNNHQYESSNNNNNNNIIINSEINENENNNKDNNNDNKNISRLCDIGLMPVNCSTETSSPTTTTLDKDTSITIVTLIDDAENLLGVTGDNANLSMNNKDSTITTNQINTRQLVEEATRTSTKLDDQQNTAMVADMLMLSPLQDVATSRTLEDLRATIGDNQHDKSLIAAGDKAEVDVGNLDAIQSKPYQLELEKKTESEAKETKETALGENIPAQLERDSSQLHENSSSAALIEVNMPELQASPVPVHLGEHNKLRNFEPPFNEQAKDNNVSKKRLVLKKFIRKNSIDTSKVLKKLATLPPSHAPKIEHIEDTPELPEETISEAAAESVTEPEVVTEESEMVVPVKPPRKVKKKVIIKRQQRRLSVSDTGFFREPVSDEPTEGTASDIEIFEKPISYVTDDEVDGDEVDAKQVTMPGTGGNVEGGPLKSCMKAREFEVGDWVMYAERFKKTMVRWKKGQVMERITSISYKLDIDGKEVPAHISYIKKYTDRKVNFGDKEYLEINYEQVEPEQSAARYYSIWNMV